MFFLKKKIKKETPGWISGFDKTKTIFTHIPKAAGTSISLALYGEDPWHYTMLHYKKILNNDIFDQYFKFCFIRNPFDRLLSSYLYSFEQIKKLPNTSVAFVTKYPSFKDFVVDWVNEKNVNSHYFFHPQSNYILDKNDNIILDYIGRFETIEEDFLFVTKKINQSVILKKTNSTKHTSYKDYYDDETIKIVHKAYQKDLELFLYKY